MTETESLTWDRDSFATLRAKWSLGRLAEDKKILSDVFNRAGKSKTLQRALNWANENAIEFFIDRATPYDGYYTEGTGVVAIGWRITHRPQRTAEVLGHEICHAWQDQQSILAATRFEPSDPSDFARHFMCIALNEASASAVEKQVGAEMWSWSDWKKDFRNHEGRGKNGEGFLLQAWNAKKSGTEKGVWAKGFFDWFSSSAAHVYGDDALRAWKHGMAMNTDEGQNFEYCGGGEPRNGGIRAADLKTALMFGNSFTEENYLTGMEARLEKTVLDVTAAGDLYGHATWAQKKQIAQLSRSGARRAA